MNIIDGIIWIIFEYQRNAKGEFIELSEDDSKAICMNIVKAPGTVRADFSINRGQVASWELTCFEPSGNCYFYGVVSSKQTAFNDNPFDGGVRDAYGIDDWCYGIYEGAKRIYMLDSHYLATYLAWNKPSLPVREVFVLRMIADWTDHKQCKLSIFYQGKKMNEANDEYTMLLPELDDEYVWYPCMTPYNRNAYCIIHFCD